MIRSIGSDSKLPSGTSSTGLGGDDPSFSRMDHIHKFWDEWVVLPLNSGWLADNSFLNGIFPYEGLRISNAGSLVEINGVIRFDGDPSTTTAPNSITSNIPKEFRPDKTIVITAYSIIAVPIFIALPDFIEIQIDTTGHIQYLNHSLVVAGLNLWGIIFSNFYYRTDYE